MEEKKFKRTTVTAALPYANGGVHIGHLAGVYVPADIYVRYLRLKNQDVMFIGGSDEHGVPVTIRARKEGITVPVIPGLKPLTTLNHCTMLPRTFHIDFPQELAHEFTKCKSNDDVKALGIEWGRHQVSELQAAGVPIIHFYTMNAAYSTERILK